MRVDRLFDAHCLDPNCPTATSRWGNISITRTDLQFNGQWFFFDEDWISLIDRISRSFQLVELLEGAQVILSNSTQNCLCFPIRIARSRRWIKKCASSSIWKLYWLSDREYSSLLSTMASQKHTAKWESSYVKFAVVNNFCKYCNYLILLQIVLQGGLFLVSFNFRRYLLPDFFQSSGWIFIGD